MPLQLRDLASSQMIEVANEGQTIGREGGQADIQLKDPGLSNRHARIFADGPDWFIEDLGSTNGTYLNGEPLDGPAPLHVGDRIRIGDSEFSLAT